MLHIVPILQGVLLHSRPKDIARLSMACKWLDAEVEMYKSQNKNMLFRLKQWNLEKDELAAILQQGGCVSGSFVLQVLLGDVYPDSDMDIYLENVAVRASLVNYLKSRGYTRSDVTIQKTRGPTYKLALDVETYERNGKVIEAMVERPDPECRRICQGPNRIPGMFYATHVMNYWDGTEIVCRTPFLTLARIMIVSDLSLDADRLRVGSLVKKYENRGFKAQYGYISGWK